MWWGCTRTLPRGASSSVSTRSLRPRRWSGPRPSSRWGKDWPEGRPHDYRRHGTVDLFAALNLLDGQVITEFHPRHRQKEFLAFLNTLDGRVSPGLQVQVVLDNRSAHKAERVQRWLRRHPRFHFHFTPTSSSWANMAEGWLGPLEQRALARGSFKSVPELKQAIMDLNRGVQSRGPSLDLDEGRPGDHPESPEATRANQRPHHRPRDRRDDGISVRNTPLGNDALGEP